MTERLPDVILDVLFEDGLLLVAVSNIGDAPALDVSCRIEPDVRGLGGTVSLNELPALRRIAFLAPGREIRVLLDTSAAYFARGEPTELAVAVAFGDRSGRRHESMIRHDLAIYRELAYVPRGGRPDGSGSA